MGTDPGAPVQRLRERLGPADGLPGDILVEKAEAGAKGPKRHTLVKVLVVCLGVVLIGWLLYREPGVRAFIVSCSDRLGPRAIPYLRGALQDPDISVRQAAGQALRRIGADAVPA